MPVLTSALLAAALAAPAGDIGAASPAAAFSLGDALLSRRPLLVETVSSSTASAPPSSFDADALIALGALALTGGALAAAASLRSPRRTGTRSPAPRFVMQDTMNVAAADFAAPHSVTAL